MKNDWHNYNEQIEKFKQRIAKSSVLEENKKVLFELENFLVLKGLSKPRIFKYFYILFVFARSVDKNFNDLSKTDIQAFISKIHQKDYSEWTKQSYRVIIKKFFQWLKGFSDDYPEEVKWIKTGFPKNREHLPNEGDLLNEEDVKKLLNCVNNLRDKAFVSVLWESGCRIGELANLRIKDVVFDQYGVVLCVFGKTGSRKIRLISSTQYLAQWMQIHPEHSLRDSWLWVNIGNRNRGERMEYRFVGVLLERLFKRAGIQKKSNPHSFRHARATFLANHLTEFQMNQYFGWVQGSEMPSTYVHLSGKNTDEALLKLYGIKIKEKTNESSLNPKQCPRCEALNSYEFNFCYKCGGMLDLITDLKDLKLTNENCLSPN